MFGFGSTIVGWCHKASNKSATPWPPPDAGGDERVFFFAATQFLQARENQPRAGRADRMAERNGAAVDVEFFARNFSERVVAAQMFARKIRGCRAIQHRQHLRGKSFVDFDEVGVEWIDAGFLLEFRHGEYRAEAHAHRIAAGIGIGGEGAEWSQAQERGLLFAHDQQGDRAVGDLRGVAGGDRASSTIENGFQFRQRFGGLIRRAGRCPGEWRRRVGGR